MKFSIRDLLLVTVIVAIMVAWWVDHARLREQVEVFKAESASFKRESDKLDRVLRVMYDSQFESSPPKPSAPVPDPAKP